MNIIKNTKKSSKRYQCFTEEEKERNCQYYRERNKNLSEDQKQKLIECRRNNYLAHKG